MTYKLIQECGLEVYRANLEIKGQMQDVVLTSDLEAFLSKAVRVYGVENSFTTVGSHKASSAQYNMDTHSGLLINYKPLPKLEPVSKDAIETIMQKPNVTLIEALSLLEKIQKAGIR